MEKLIFYFAVFLITHSLAFGNGMLELDPTARFIRLLTVFLGVTLPILAVIVWYVKNKKSKEDKVVFYLVAGSALFLLWSVYQIIHTSSFSLKMFDLSWLWENARPWLIISIFVSVLSAFIVGLQKKFLKL